jgi:hypothetical protein
MKIAPKVATKYEAHLQRDIFVQENLSSSGAFKNVDKG